MSGARLADARRGGPIAWTPAAIVPSLAAATTLSAALWMTAAVLVSSLAAALLAALAARRPWPAPLAVPVLLAVLVGAADRAAAAWLPAQYEALGISLPLAVLLVPSSAAAAALREGRRDGRVGRAVRAALVGTLAFLGATAGLALAREALGAGTVTLLGLPVDRTIPVPGIAAAPARALLLPFGGLIAGGYLAGLVVRIARSLEHGKDRRAAGSAPSAPPPRAGGGGAT